MQKNSNPTHEAATVPNSGVVVPPAAVVAINNTHTNGGGVPACASCRHQRKKCTDKCVLSPFFPVERTEDFLAVHKVFGVSNVTKLVKDLSREDGEKVVESLIWEANMRKKDPVWGSYGEYKRIRDELMAYKAKYQQAVAHQHQHHRQGQVPVTHGCAATAAVAHQHHHQVPVTQGGAGVLYNNKSAPQRFIGSWNGHNNGTQNGMNMMNCGINNSNVLDYIHGNGINGGMDNSRLYNYGSLQNMEKLKQEKDQNGSQILPHQQLNGFDQSYY